MRTGTLIAVLCALCIAGVVFLLERGRIAVAPSPTTPAQPEYGWKSVATRSFALAPGEKTRWDVKAKGKLRMTVNAEAPVNFQFDIGGCEAKQVLSATEECTIKATPFPTLLLNDTRDSVAVPVGAGLAGAWVRSKTVVEMSAKAIATNRVNVELFRWQCIANCRPD